VDIPDDAPQDALVQSSLAFQVTLALELQTDEQHTLLMCKVVAMIFTHLDRSSRSGPITTELELIDDHLHRALLEAIHYASRTRKAKHHATRSLNAYMRVAQKALRQGI
jgi:hypothetical protein